MDTTKEGSLQPPDPSGERARVTAETVRQAQEEREGAYIRLMDAMEKSVGEKGQYFVEFGHKKDTSGRRYSDTRALLLIKSAVDPKDDSNIFIAITREGVKGLRFISQDKSPQDQDEAGEAVMRDIIQRTLARKYPLGGNKDFYEQEGGLRDMDGTLVIGCDSDTLFFPNSGRFTARYTEVRPVDSETVRTTIEESQRAAEIPHFVKLQQEQQRLADANTLMGVIKQLPPKQ